MTSNPTKQELKERVCRLEAEIAALKRSHFIEEETDQISSKKGGGQSESGFSAGQYYRLIIENAADLILMVNEQGDFSYISPNCRNILGYGPETYIGSNFISFVHPDDAENIIATLSDIFAQYQSSGAAGVGRFTLDFRALTRNRDWRWLSASNTLVKEAGSHIEVLCIARDITEQKLAAKKLAESEERYRFLVEESNDIIWTFDLSVMKFTYASRSVEHILGFSPKEVEGSGLGNVFSPSTEKLIMGAFYSAINEKNGTGRVLMEAEHVKDNRSRVWMEINAVLHRDDSNNPVFFTGITRDVTERRLAEKENEKLQARLSHAKQMEAIGRLAGGIAHDFNNILTAVLGYTELSMDEVDKQSLVHQNLSQVMAAGARAKDLVKQILAVSRREKESFRPFSAAPFIREFLQKTAPSVPDNIDLCERISENDMLINGDPLQLEQVMANLVRNAVNAMENKGGVLTVGAEPFVSDEAAAMSSSDEPAPDCVRISVSDTGAGIAEEFLDKIFEPYFTNKKEGTGTGLGLSIVHGIVRSHKGHLRVESQPGKGSIFYVHLPLVKAGDAAGGL